MKETDPGRQTFISESALETSICCAIPGQHEKVLVENQSGLVAHHATGLAMTHRLPQAACFYSQYFAGA